MSLGGSFRSLARGELLGVPGGRRPTPEGGGMLPGQQGPPFPGVQLRCRRPGPDSGHPHCSGPPPAPFRRPRWWGWGSRTWGTWTPVRAWLLSLAGPQVRRFRARGAGRRAGPPFRGRGSGRGRRAQAGFRGGRGLWRGGASEPGARPFPARPDRPARAGSAPPPAKIAASAQSPRLRRLRPRAAATEGPAGRCSPGSGASGERAAHRAACGAREPGGPPRCSPRRRRGTSRSRAAASSASTISAWPPASASTRPSWWPTPRTSMAPRPGRSRPRRWSPGPAWVRGPGGLGRCPSRGWSGPFRHHGEVGGGLYPGPGPRVQFRAPARGGACLVLLRGCPGSGVGPGAPLGRGCHLGPASRARRLRGGQVQQELFHWKEKVVRGRDLESRGGV